MSINKPTDETSPDHPHQENGETDASKALNYVYGLSHEQDQ